MESYKCGNLYKFLESINQRFHLSLSAGSHPLGQVLVQACGSASVAQLSSSLLLFRAGRHSSLGDEAEASKGVQAVTRVEGSSDGTYPTGSHEYRLD